jgi:Domain of unknown function (DUF4440)
MRNMKCVLPLRLLTLVLPLVCLAAPVALAQDAKVTQDTVTRLLQEFLARNDEPAQHDRFWAADLVYTSSKGEVMSKADIMKAVSGGDAGPKDTYSAEDILVRPYGTTAALTFRLVRHTPDGKLQYYRNSGTLLQRNGLWQVVTWQATKVAAPEEKP